MKPFDGTLIHGTAIVAILTASAVSAAPVTDARRMVQSEIGSDGAVQVFLDENGVATLTGYAHSSQIRHKAEQAARKADGVEDVINLINY